MARVAALGVRATPLFPPSGFSQKHSLGSPRLDAGCILTPPAPPLLSEQRQAPLPTSLGLDARPPPPLGRTDPPVSGAETSPGSPLPTSAASARFPQLPADRQGGPFTTAPSLGARNGQVEAAETPPTPGSPSLGQALDRAKEEMETWGKGRPPAAGEEPGQRGTWALRSRPGDQIQPSRSSRAAGALAPLSRPRPLGPRIGSRAAGTGARLGTLSFTEAPRLSTHLRGSRVRAPPPLRERRPALCCGRGVSAGSAGCLERQEGERGRKSRPKALPLEFIVETRPLRWRWSPAAR